MALQLRGDSAGARRAETSWKQESARTGKPDQESSQDAEKWLRVPDTLIAVS